MSAWRNALGVMKTVNPSEVEMLGLEPDLFCEELSYEAIPLKPSTVAPDPEVLAVLSAASYPTFEQTNQVERNHALDPSLSEPEEFNVLENDIQLDANSTMARSNPMRQARRIQSQKKSSGKAGNRSPKRRGRSPKPTESESPSERRRGQIRRAQRAYRLRQEATVLSLKSRVTQLENLVEKMNQIFLSLGDDLKESGVLEICPNLELKLREATKNYMMLTRQNNESNENKVESTKNTGSDSNPSTSDVNGTSNMTLAAKRSSSSEGVPTPHSDQTCAQRDFNFPEIWERPIAYSMNFYHSDKKRFSERLKYACAKRAYRFLIDPTITNSRLLKPFRFVMTMMTRDQITAYFRMFLESCGAPEVMELCNVPEISLGGAGTHYPRKLPTAQQNSLTHTTTRQRIIVVDNASLSEDYRGEWFDTEDVEGFLEECGVLLDRQNSIWDSAKGSSSTSSGIVRGSLPERTLYSDSFDNFSHKRSRETAPTVDERQLISFFSTSFCICLGHTVGFRRKDVETFVLHCRRPLELESSNAIATATK